MDIKNVTGNKLTHMTHAEEMMFFGKEGVELTLESLREIFEAIKGSTPKMTFTYKIDGSPSIMIASNFNGETFVATKALHNKKGPLYARTPEECHILWGHKPDLEHKMLTALKYAPELQIPEGEIWQGDFLYSKEDLKKELIEDEEYITFQPNTLVYAIKVGDPICTRILNSEIGIAWHTINKGPDLYNLKASFKVDLNKIKSIPEVFTLDVNVPSIAGSGTLTDIETGMAEQKLEQIEALGGALTTDDAFYEVIKNQKLIDLWLKQRSQSVFNLIGEGPNSLNSQTSKTFINDEYAAIIKGLKVDKAINRRSSERDTLINFISSNINTINNMFAFQNNVVALKNFFVKKLNVLCNSNFRTFVNHINKGYLPCGREGYAISDQIGNVLKLVSRLEFSANNNNKAIVKGWMSDQRNSTQASAIKEATEKKPQFEDYVVNGDYDLDDIVLSLEEILNALRGTGESNANRAQIFGSPAVMIASDFNGQALVSTREEFFKKIYATTEADCNTLWGNDPVLCEGMINLLKRAPSIKIPQNQIWLGDIIFFESSLRKEKINEDNYYTFEPDSIKYMIAEKDPMSSKVENSKVGIAWRAAYKGSTIDSLKLFLDTTTDHIRFVPEIFQMDGDIVDITGKSTLTIKETKKVEDAIEKLSSRREFILNHENYHAMRLSKEFSKEIIKFKNHITSSTSSEKWRYFNARGFKSYENAIFEENKVNALNDLKRSILEEKRLEFVRIVNRNKDLLDAIFYVQKLVIKLKEFLSDKILKMGSVADIKDYISDGLLPAAYEGTALIVQDDNTANIVSAIPFNACDATKELVSEWFQTPEKLIEANLYDTHPEAGDFYRNLISNAGVEVKKDETNSKSFHTNVMPKEDVSRDDASKNMQAYLQLYMQENPNTINAQFKIEDGRRLVANISFKIPNDKAKRTYKAEVIVKPRAEEKMDAAKTKAMEELHMAYLAELNKNGVDGLNIVKEGVSANDLTTSWVDAIVRESNGIIKWLNNEPYTYSREEATTSPDNREYESIHGMIIDVFKNKEIFNKGAARDSWNPSDIYACATRVYDEFVREWKAAVNDENVSLDSLNALLKKYLDNKTVVGISLKKASKDVKVFELGYNPERKERDYDFVITNKDSILIPNFEIDYNKRGCAGTYIWTTHINEKGEELTTKWDYRKFPAIALETSDYTRGASTAHNGKCEKNVLKYYFRKYSLLEDDTYTEMKNKVLGHYSDSKYLNMVKDVVNSDFSLMTSNGIPLNEDTWIAFANKCDMFFNNPNEFVNEYPDEDYLINEDLKTCQENTFNVIRMINFYYMIINAKKAGDEAYKDMMSTLYLSSAHDSNFNAPYIKVQ